MTPLRRVAANPARFQAFEYEEPFDQKAAYLLDLAQKFVAEEIPTRRLSRMGDEEVIEALVTVKGIGRWTAEIYLLFAEGRTDVWPAGDLAIQIETGRIMGLDGKPTEKRIRELSEPWRPHRGAFAIFAWHHRRSSGNPV